MQSRLLNPQLITNAGLQVVEFRSQDLLIHRQQPMPVGKLRVRLTLVKGQLHAKNQLDRFTCLARDHPCYGQTHIRTDAITTAYADH